MSPTSTVALQVEPGVPTSAELRRLLGHYPTGVCVVAATGRDGLPRALVIGSFTSVSLDPPLVGFFPMHSSGSWSDMAKIGHFCINVLGSDQAQLCKQMAGAPHQRFDGIGYHTGTGEGHGLLLDDAILHIECDLHSVTEAGDHWFVLGRISHIMLNRDHEPLLFHRGSYARVGLPQCPGHNT